MTITGTIEAVTGAALYGAFWAPWSVVNQGLIEALNGAGIQFNALSGAEIRNASAGLISAYSRIDLVSGGGTVFNEGIVDGAGNAGIVLAEGGVVINSEGGTIASAEDGVYVSSGAGSVVNQGVISGHDTGVVLAHGGTVTNSAGATIFGHDVGGTDVGAGIGAVVTNAGTVSAPPACTRSASRCAPMSARASCRPTSGAASRTIASGVNRRLICVT